MKEGPGANRWLAGGALAILASLAFLQAFALHGMVAEKGEPAAAVAETPPARVPMPRLSRENAPREAAAGRGAAETPAKPRRSRATRADDPAPPAENADLARLRAENADLRARLDDMLNWVVENLRGRFPLEERHMGYLRVPPVDEESGGVSEDLALLLRLTDDEADRMDDAFEASRVTLRELEEEGVSVRVDDAAWQQGMLDATLTFAPYAEDGELVKEALYDELRATLGRARFARLLQVSEAGLGEAMDYFGNRERTLRISEVLTDDGADGGEIVMLVIRDETVTPDPDNPDRQFVRATESITWELPEEYERFAALLPDRERQ